MNGSYEGLEGEWHDLFWEAEEAPDEICLLREFLEGKEGECLYVGSGSGRLLGPLVEAGFEVLGLEVSGEMISMSRERWPEAKVIEGAWQQHEGSYDRIIIPAFTFQLFEDPEKQLKRLREQAEELYVTLFFPWAELSGELPENEWYFDRAIELEDGEVGELETRHRLKESAGSLVRRHRYRYKNDKGEVLKEEETEQKLRFFTDAGLKGMLKRTGWEVVKEVDLGENYGDGVVYVATLFLKGAY